MRRTVHRGDRAANTRVMVNDNGTRATLALALSFASLASACSGGQKTEHIEEVWLLGSDQAETSDAVDVAHADGPAGFHFQQIAQTLADDPMVKGVLLRFDAWSAPMGTSGRLKDGVATLRARNLAIHCHLLGADMESYLAAAESCDRITLIEAGELDTRGIAFEWFHLRELLDTLGIVPEIIQVGDRKGAADPFTRKTPRAEVQEGLAALATTQLDLWIASVAKARKLELADVKRAVEGAPIDAQSAKALGLVDAVETLATARDALMTATGVTHFESPEQRKRISFNFGQLFALIASGDSDTPPPGAYIALVPIQGMIGSFQGSQAQDERLIEALNKAARDPECTAVVVSMDSPGGSARLSDRLFLALKAVRARKPLVVHIDTMAASGGYYIAAAGTEIIAQPAALIGSIGVVGGKPNFAPLLDRIGIRAASASAGAHASMQSATRGFTPSETDRIVTLMQQTHARFVQRVVDGRGLAPEAVAAYADGRLMSAEDAKGAKLIDSLGTLGQALERAQILAEVRGSLPVRVCPKPPSRMERLTESLSSVALSDGDALESLAVLKRALALESWRRTHPLNTPLQRAVVLAELLERERVLAIGHGWLTQTVQH